MSGGHFGYKQYEINYIADEVEQLIAGNENSEYAYNPETILRFQQAVYLLRKAAVYVQRIDWLVCSDDGEETFHERLRHDLGQISVPEVE